MLLNKGRWAHANVKLHFLIDRFSTIVYKRGLILVDVCFCNLSVASLTLFKIAQDIARWAHHSINGIINVLLTDFV